jgi:hypothetical protein
MCLKVYVNLGVILWVYTNSIFGEFVNPNVNFIKRIIKSLY